MNKIWFIPLIVIYTILSSSGLFFLKKSQLVVDSVFLYGFVLYLGGFVLWLYILKNYPLSIAFPVASSGIILATQLIGFLFFEEPITTLKVTGISMIIIGIIILHWNN